MIIDNSFYSSFLIKIKVTNNNLPLNLSITFYLLICFIQKSTQRLDEHEPVADIAINSQEHPSPVSVLDGSVYRDDEPSPLNQVADTPKGIAPVFELSLKRMGN